MLVSGLRGGADAMAAGADWVAEQVVAGRRVLDSDMIETAVQARGLLAGPARAVVSVATLTPDPLAAQARHALDWVDRFDGPDAYAKRHPKPPATWQQLQADIEAIPGHLGPTSHVVITGSLRQATAFTVGAALRMVTNTDITVVQRGALWTSDAPYAGVWHRLADVEEFMDDDVIEQRDRQLHGSPVDVETIVLAQGTPPVAASGSQPEGACSSSAAPRQPPEAEIPFHIIISAVTIICNYEMQ